MKFVGFFLITVGGALLLFVFYNFLKEQDKMISPVPQEKGVKVIFVTPSK